MTAPNPNLFARLEFIVDHEAEPCDIDEAVADFLIAYVRGEVTETEEETDE